MGKKNTGGTQDDAVIKAETAFLLSQLDDIRLQEEFLEEERRKLVEQQEFDFEGLLSRLQAQLAQQQEGFDQQLASSENILGQLGERTQQLSGVLEQQAQNREQIAQGAQETLQRGQGFLSSIGQNVAQQTGQAAEQIGQRAQGIQQEALAGDPATQARQRFLAAEGQAAQQRIGQERERVIGQTQRTEAQNRQRRQEALSNLRGQRATPQQQAPTGTTRQTITRNPEADRDRFLSSLPQNVGVGPVPSFQQREAGRISQPGRTAQLQAGIRRTLADEEEFLANQLRLREQQQGRQDFVGAISGQRRNGNSARRL